MQTQKVFRAGNSNVVAIPKDLLKEMNIKPGQKVSISKLDNEDSILIKKETGLSTKPGKKVIDKEFNKWLKKVMKEDEEILKELAVR